MAQASDLAKCLGESSVALMRGHGFAAAARSLIEVVLSVYLPRNARALMRARQLGGEIKYLSQGEIEARNRGYSPIRSRPGAAGNIGRPRPAAATC
jgi:ribulose-5-phosphate 4-epimerase/fuculose-1-phosphate aldolase